MNVLDVLFPKSCLECKKEGGYICESCLKKIHFAKQTCVECERAAIDGITHERCRQKQSLEGSFSVWKYEGVICKTISALKYHFASEIAQELAEKSAKNLQENFIPLPRKAIFIPIPLHTARYNWRGFNQATEIGKHLSIKMHWKFVSDFLVRKKSSEPQANLSKKERQKNVLGLYALNGKYRNHIPEDISIIIFDDVRTTGATLKEAGKVVKRNGVKKVWGLTIAK